MAFCGKFTPVVPGEQRNFALNFAPDLAAQGPFSADSIASITSVTLSDPSGTDPNPSALLIGSPGVLASTWVVQTVGGTGATTFMSGVPFYLLTMTVLTAAGQTFILSGHIPVATAT